MSTTAQQIKDMQKCTEQIQKWDELLEEVALGYFRTRSVGGIADEFIWGGENDRGIEKPCKSDMKMSYFREGLQQVRLDTCIKIMMKEEWMEGSGMEHIVGKSIMDIPLLVLTEEGKKALSEGELKPVEGLGRQGGVEFMCEQIDEKVGMLEEAKKKLEEVKKKKDDHNFELGKMVMEIEELKEAREQVTWWMY